MLTIQTCQVEAHFEAFDEDVLTGTLSFQVHSGWIEPILLKCVFELFCVVKLAPFLESAFSNPINYEYVVFLYIVYRLNYRLKEFK